MRNMCNSGKDSFKLTSICVQKGKCILNLRGIVLRAIGMIILILIRSVIIEGIWVNYNQSTHQFVCCCKCRR